MYLDSGVKFIFTIKQWTKKESKIYREIKTRERNKVSERTRN